MSGRRSYLEYPQELPGSSAQGGSSNVAPGNYVAIDRGAPANTSAAPAAYVVAAIVLTPLVSGIFRIDASLAVTDSSSETVTMAILAAEQTTVGTPIAVVGGTAAGQVGSTAAAGSTGDTSTTAATAISFTGANTGGAKTIATKTVQAVATDPIEITTGGIFSFSTGGVTKTPFTVGQECVIYIALTAAAGTLSAQNLDFTVQEQPYT
jgi:hypothetical protein